MQSAPKVEGRLPFDECVLASAIDWLLVRPDVTFKLADLLCAWPQETDLDEAVCTKLRGHDQEAEGVKLIIKSFARADQLDGF